MSATQPPLEFVREGGAMQFSKQSNEFFDREAGLADDGAERAAIEFLVIGNGGLGWRRLAHDDDMAPTLSINFKAKLSYFTANC